MSKDTQPFSEAFALIAELAHLLGVKAINRLPGCWELSLPNGWWLAVNGRRTPVRCSRGVEVPTFSAYVERCDFPAGILDPYGGVLVGYGSRTEADLIAALRSEVAKIKGV